MRFSQRACRARDRGATFVEILVAVVVLGTAVAGTLTALRTTIVSSKLDGGQATASVWLRAAEEALHREPYRSCEDFAADAIGTEYRAVIQAIAPPAGWEAATINITEVQFWGRDGDRHEGWLPVCAQDPLAAQLIDIYVLSPAGDVGRHLQVVKRG